MLTLQERRRHPRQIAKKQVEITVGRWPWRQRFTGTLRDCSSSGLSVDLPASATTSSFDRKVDVHWEIPATLTGTENGLRATMSGTLAYAGNPSDTTTRHGIRFQRLVDDVVRARHARWKKMLAAVAATALAAAIVLLKTRNIVSFWYDPLIQLYSIGAAVYVVSRVGFSMVYREPKDNALFKSVSLIIAVKNEELNISATIERCFSSHYPAHLMEVMVVDDGSTDGTWDVLTRLSKTYPGLKVFRFTENKGKRHAMALGAEKASGEILIYLDSDSMVDPEGIYRIVQPFADETVGAVAGHTLMIVERDNFISKMETVRYYVSQRIMKAAESIFGAVTCCPGPFSAYRREAVLQILQPWLNQRFMGTAATFGDDRSLTNFILRRYRVVYHAGARCSTFAPSRWKMFVRQQLRWKKSWVRETTIAVRWMWREHPFAALSYYFSIVITLVSPLIVLRAFFYSPAVLQTHAYLPYMAGLMLVFLFLGLVYYYHTQSRYWYYGVAFAVLYGCFFCLQNYYAILTVRQNHWGTR